MDNKEIIGNKIREEREKRGLTREQFCACESQLTVRQLLRIEQGKSLPTLPKLEYIAETLDLSVADLLGEQSIKIPETYFEKKYLLFKSSSYGDTERMAEKHQIIEEIYQEYFDVLPDEELLTLDLIERLLDWRAKPQGEGADCLFADYFEQVLVKETYVLNDLLLLQYYAAQCQDIAYESERFTICFNKVLKQSIQGHEFYNVALLGALSAFAAAYLISQEYEQMLKAVDRMDEIIQKTLQQVYRPVTLCFRAKYYVYHAKDVTTARQIYELAVLLAQEMGDSLLLDNLTREKDNDLAELG